MQLNQLVLKEEASPPLLLCPGLMQLNQLVLKEDSEPKKKPEKKKCS